MAASSGIESRFVLGKMDHDIRPNNIGPVVVGQSFIDRLAHIGMFSRSVSAVDPPARHDKT
jgi:hypothetical protein